MALIKCPECEKPVSDKASSCPNCGFQLIQNVPLKQKTSFHDSFFEAEKLETTSFHDSFEVNNRRQKENQKKKSQFILIPIGIIVFVLIYFMNSNDSKSPASWEQKDARIEAYVMAQQYIEQRLKSPSTAKYPLNASECTNRIEGQQYKINAFVDSQNGFGAMIRTNFVVVVEQYEEGKWELIELQIN